MTASTTSKRNTPRAGVRRNTVSSGQLDAFPTSENQRLKQHARKRAVVSLRMRGDDIARLDAEVARLDREGAHRQTNRPGAPYQLTRTDVVERALALYFNQTSKKGR